MTETPDAPAHRAFTGVVVAGGSSSRMGTDKAFLELDGEPLIVGLVARLVAGGADEVMVIGGDVERLRGLGLEARPDVFPGEGPLGGLVAGLDASRTDLVFVSACDQPSMAVGVPRRLIRRWVRTDADAVVPIVHGRRQVLAGLYHRRALEQLRTRFGAGERSVQRAIDGLDVAELDGLDPAWFFDLDRPEDVVRYRRRPDSSAT